MKRTLVIHVRGWHVAAGLFLLVALTGGSVLAKVGPSSFRPAGSFMVASVSANDLISLTTTSVEVLHKPITVPAGKTADLYVFFNGLVTSVAGNGYVEGTIRLDDPSTAGRAFAPGFFQISLPAATKVVSLVGQGYKYSVPDGAHTVYLTADSTGADLATRTLTIIANIHD